MDRERFLAGLRERLAAAPAPSPLHPVAPVPHPVPRVDLRPDPRPLEERFVAAMAELSSRAVTVAELPQALADLGVRTAVVTTDRVPLPPEVEAVPLERVWEADAGVTCACGACAATGTVLVAASPDEPRAASLVPPVHVVAVPRERLVETPGDLLRDLPRLLGRPEGSLPSAFTLISGPSRSADIAGELTLGVHGPTTVVAVLVDGR
jgi:L-lactate utilization protein LutC